MAKNIVIFSDGTGQAGGINFDEARTNVYKLYRACRVGPDAGNLCEQYAELLRLRDEIRRLVASRTRTGRPDQA
jgi:hypothetical protein